MQGDGTGNEGAAGAVDDGSGGVPGAGLCNACAWQRVVVSGRGSRFSMCRLAARDARFAKYPRLPVVACVGKSP